MPKKLTPKELEAVRHIRNSFMHKAKPPSVRELKTLLGYRSPRSAAVIINRLIDYGLLHRNTEGTIRLMKSHPDEEHHAQTIDVPLVGRVAGGQPIFAQENIEAFFPVSTKLASPPHKYFILNVIGDSMNRAGINNGDMVLVRRQSTAQDGDKVIALIDDEATVKEFHRTKYAIILQPRSTNPINKPIILTSDFQIQGVVVTSLGNF